jgi:hypothetical protein
VALSADSSAPGSAGKAFQLTGSYDWMLLADITLCLLAALPHLPIPETLAAPIPAAARLSQTT